MEKYNGWTNYATWRVNLEIFDGMDYKEVFGNGDDDFDPKMVDAYELSESLKSYAQEIIDTDCDPSRLANSYANAFLSEVNWIELANNAIDCMIDEQETQERYESNSGR